MFFIIMVCLVGMTLVLASEPVSTDPIVGKGCVGECGKTAEVKYKVTASISKMMVVKTVNTSLCPNTGAFAFLFKNGKEVAQGSITKLNASLQTEAAPGDQIIVYVMTYPLFNGIVCIRLGELNFVLLEYDLEKKK